MRSASLSCVLAFGLVAHLGACGGEPLEDLPDDVEVRTYFEVFEPEPGVPGSYASLYMQTASCLQLAGGTEMLFEGALSPYPLLGGRASNPFSAYIATACELPSAYWDSVEAEAPFTFEVRSGDISLLMEVDDEGAVTRCDFPRCVFEGPPPRPEPAP